MCVTTCYPINNSNLNKMNKMRYKTEIIIITTIIIVITIPMVLKYQVGIWQGITNHLMATEGPLALLGNLYSDGVTIQIMVSGT